MTLWQEGAETTLFRQVALTLGRLPALNKMCLEPFSCAKAFAPAASCRSGRTDEQDVRLGELDVVMLGLSTLPRALEGEAGKLLFATNAGMFDPALKPVGLYVEQGRELVRANTRSKPNGVFYLSADRAAVAETGAFLKQRAPPSEKAMINPRSVERERPVGDTSPSFFGHGTGVRCSLTRRRRKQGGRQ
jgi:hypothetical protein